MAETWKEAGERGLRPGKMSQSVPKIKWKEKSISFIQINQSRNVSEISFRRTANCFMQTWLSNQKGSKIIDWHGRPSAGKHWANPSARSTALGKRKTLPSDRGESFKAGQTWKDRPRENGVEWCDRQNGQDFIWRGKMNEASRPLSLIAGRKSVCWSQICVDNRVVNRVVTDAFFQATRWQFTDRPTNPQPHD